jgi:hypothetical protein
VAVRVDQSDDGDGPSPAPDAASGSPQSPDTPRRPPNAGGLPDVRAAGGQGETRGGPEAADVEAERRAQIGRALEYRAIVDAKNRTYAIDRAYEKIREIERDTVTPAMKRIEAEDSDRHLAGLENRRKGKDRFTEKVVKALDEQPQLTYGSAIALVKDAIRYTFQYTDNQYTAGVLADCNRLEQAGFKRVDRRNTWESPDYKGINSRWWAPESEQMLEVQFHTQASYEAKQETHVAYEKLRAPATPKAEQEQLAEYQRQVNSRVRTPPDALDIPDYP